MLTATFTDPQGTVQTDAILHVRTANFTSSSHQNYGLSPADFTTIMGSPATTNAKINYSIYYWINAASKAAGAHPYTLVNETDIDEDFSFEPDSTYEGLTLEAKVEKHITDVVLPTMPGI